ncbi:hypothetical protein DFH06DRAFT_1159985 [Mycena polygramma]|nr:hypothetical protein DFH06DRAFT_1159985 [Mycena polygramma]
MGKEEGETKVEVNGQKQGGKDDSSTWTCKCRRFERVRVGSCQREWMSMVDGMGSTLRLSVGGRGLFLFSVLVFLLHNFFTSLYFTFLHFLTPPLILLRLNKSSPHPPPPSSSPPCPPHTPPPPPPASPPDTPTPPPPPARAPPPSAAGSAAAAPARGATRARWPLGLGLRREW